MDRQSLLTPDEQITLMTLWAMFRSPLMFGGDLPSSDPQSLALLCNEEVLAINQSSINNRELVRQGEYIVWTADSSTTADKYLALFNIGEDSSASIEIDLTLLTDSSHGYPTYALRDLWNHTDLGIVQDKLHQSVLPHAAKLFCLHPHIQG